MSFITYSGLVLLKFLLWAVILLVALIFIGYLLFITVRSIREWRKK